MACGGKESKDGSKDWRQQLEGGVCALRTQETRTEGDLRVAFGTSRHTRRDAELAAGLASLASVGKVYAREVNLTSKAMKQTEKVKSAPERGVSTSSEGAAAGAE